jgi:hypothetical protein
MPGDVVDIDQRRVKAHPGMGIGFAFGTAAADRDRVHPVRQGRRGDIAKVCQELFEPAFKVQAVPQHKVGIRSGDNILRCWFIAVNLGPGLGDGHNLDPRARDIAGHVGDDGKGGHDLQPIFSQAGLGQKRQGNGQQDRAARLGHGMAPWRGKTGMHMRTICRIASTRSREAPARATRGGDGGWHKSRLRRPRD